jgi:hypothetical protein
MIKKIIDINQLFLSYFEVSLTKLIGELGKFEFNKQ